ncbi:MAG: ThiF family adenylyltransferase [Candidatus Kaiserbacteria bacterium]|nr:ThiF family adenylyltransferase [Candidatus Kaiserbacteria bacterium]MCB9816415.1 ThiF family adenylyltransferase [Candidatus Nomurabacteria bacterium]
MAENFAHQMNLFDPRLARPVVVIGAGAIGSWVTLALAKMGVSDITVIDGDTVASHNGSMSLYTGADTARLKVEVLRERVRELAGVEIKVVPEMYSGGPLPKGVTVIASVDTIPARKLIWKQLLQQRFSHDLLVDTRTSAAYAEVYAVNPKNGRDREEYERSLPPEDKAAPQTCGFHGVIFASLHVAACVASTVARYWQTGQKVTCRPLKSDTFEVVKL